MATNAPTTTQTPWLTVVMSADENFQREKHHQLFYKFDSFGRPRRFYADPNVSGAFAPATPVQGVMTDFSTNFKDSPLR